MSDRPAGAVPANSALPVVLIVEDEEQIAELIASVVREAGYMPLVAYHGRQALELARTHRLTLLITDLMIPYLDGKALIAALRADTAAGGKPTPPIIMITAAGMAQARAAGAAADAVLRKPFEIAALETLLNQFLRGPTSKRAATE